MIKKILSLSLVFVLFTCASFTVFASEDNSTLKVVNSKITTLALDEIPKNNEFIIVETEEEMLAIMKSLKIEPMRYSKDSVILETESSRSGDYTYKTVSDYKGLRLTIYNSDGSTRNALTKFNVEARVKIYNSGSFGEILGTSYERSYLSGVTTGMTLTDTTNYDGSVSRDKQSVTLRSKGTVDYYFFITSIGAAKMWSNEIEHSFKYSI